MKSFWSLLPPSVVRDVILVAAVLLVAAAVPYAATAIMVILIPVAMRSVESSLKAISLVALVKTVNPSIHGGQFGPIQILGWVALFLAGAYVLMVVFRHRARLLMICLLLLFFGANVALGSFVSSDYVIISIFKIASFTFCAFFVFSGYRYLASRGISLLPWFAAIWTAVLVLSFLVLPFASIAYSRDGQGFQGILNHPQALAVVLAPAAGWATLSVLLRQSRSLHCLAIAMLPVCWFAIILTRGRTAVVAVGIAFVFALVASLWSSSWRRDVASAIAAPKVVLMALALMITGAMFPTTIVNGVTGFLLKGQTEKDFGEAFESSRGFIIAESMENFYERPLLGIGFGISNSSRFQFNPVIEPVTGLPLSASTEKPNIVVALLEETGLIGFLAFLPFLLELLRNITTRAPLTIGVAGVAAFAVNVSETIFFSMGGIGLYALIIIGLAFAGEDSAVRLERRSGDFSRP